MASKRANQSERIVQMLSLDQYDFSGLNSRLGTLSKRSLIPSIMSPSSIGRFFILFNSVSGVFGSVISTSVYDLVYTVSYPDIPVSYTHLTLPTILLV